MLGSHLEELVHDVVGRSGSIYEEEVIVSNIIFKEEFAVVFLLVETDDAGHSELLENLHVFLGVVAVSLIGVSLLNRPHKSHKLARNNPVDVAILNTLIILILLHVECSELVPFEFDGIFKALEALQESALIEAIALAGISIWFEQAVVGSKHIPSLLRRAFQNNDHESTHQKCSIDHLISLVTGAIMENPIIRIILIPEQPRQLPGVPVDHGEVEGAEVLIEWEVCQIIVNVEKEGILVILGWLRSRHPV